MAKTIEKRSAEQVRVDIDCSQLLAVGEAIVSIIEITVDGAATVPPLSFASIAAVASPVVYHDHTAPANTVVRAVVSGGKIAAGLNSSSYVCRCRVVTNISPIVEAAFVVRVDDMPDGRS